MERQEDKLRYEWTSKNKIKLFQQRNSTKSLSRYSNPEEAFAFHDPMIRSFLIDFRNEYSIEKIKIPSSFKRE